MRSSLKKHKMGFTGKSKSKFNLTTALLNQCGKRRKYNINATQVSYKREKC